MKNTLVFSTGLPRDVMAFCTSRDAGVSQAPFDRLNVGTHVGDNPASVDENRRRLHAYVRSEGALSAPIWLSQVHGTDVMDLDQSIQGPQEGVFEADAATTSSPGKVAVIMTADCLPIVITASVDSSTLGLGVVHAGWRGLASGVIEAAHASLADKLGKGTTPQAGLKYRAWFGPAIGPDAFEVGHEVREALLASSPKVNVDEAAFKRSATSSNQEKYLADLYALARTRLAVLGYAQISGGNFCTVRDSGTFFSHRRDAKLLGSTGRMATCAWIKPT